MLREVAFVVTLMTLVMMVVAIFFVDWVSECVKLRIDVRMWRTHLIFLSCSACFLRSVQALGRLAKQTSRRVKAVAGAWLVETRLFIIFANMCIDLLFVCESLEGGSVVTRVRRVRAQPALYYLLSVNDDRQF